MTDVFCIPKAGGFPAITLPPQWWDNTISPGDFSVLNAYYPWVDDARWAGAFEKNHGDGSSPEHVSFRALYYTIGGTDTYLYLSWYIKVDPESGYSNNYVAVGLNPNNGAPTPLNPALLIYVKLSSAANSGTGLESLPNFPTPLPSPKPFPFFTPQVQRHTGSAWALVPNNEVDTWNWLAGTTRIWSPGTDVGPWWAVQMRIPVKTIPNGINLGSVFGLCYYVQVYSNAFGVIPYKWPDTLKDLPPADNGDYPNPTTPPDFFPCSLGNPPAPYTCYSTGITLPMDHIGTKNVQDPQTHLLNPQDINIKIGSTTRFFARPVNNNPGLTIPAGQIKAIFRLANWGSITSSDPGLWNTLNGNLIDHPEIKPAGSLQNEQDILMDWTLSSVTDSAFYQANPHQCMLVTLSSGYDNLQFVNASVARNMDFVPSSKFTRNAEISVKGLTPISPGFRDVYIYVEKVNMPAKIYDATLKKYTIGYAYLRRLFGEQGKPITEGAMTYGTEPIKLEDYVPTCRYHVYHDTGRKQVVGGKTVRILEPQSSFGYYVMHDGDLQGWDFRLRNAIKLAENLYWIKVINNGSATVTNVIQAVQPGDTPEPPDPGPETCLETVLKPLGPFGRLLLYLLKPFIS